MIKRFGTQIYCSNKNMSLSIFRIANMFLEALSSKFITICSETNTTTTLNRTKIWFQVIDKLQCRLSVFSKSHTTIRDRGMLRMVLLSFSLYLATHCEVVKTPPWPRFPWLPWFREHCRQLSWRRPEKRPIVQWKWRLTKLICTQLQT